MPGPDGSFHQGEARDLVRGFGGTCNEMMLNTAVGTKTLERRKGCTRKSSSRATELRKTGPKDNVA